MKKRNLAILACLPFLLALLGVSTATAFMTTLAKDITGIRFDYQDNEGLKVGNTLTLKAEPIYDAKYLLDEGNALVWSEAVEDGASESHVSLAKEGNYYVLTALNEGRSKITCSNEKGTVSKSFTLLTYEHGAILVNRVKPESGSRISPKQYLGEYDVLNGQKSLAQVKYNIQVEPRSLSSNLTVKDMTSNISFDLSAWTLHVLSPGSSSLTFTVHDSSIPDVTLSYEIIENGINAYTYDDLLYATKTEPSPLVLQTSFGRLSDCYYFNEKGGIVIDDKGQPVTKDSSLALFGHYDFQNKNFSFENEVYRHPTTFHHAFLDQWNTFANQDATDGYEPMEEDVLAALHVAKDLYGNGYSLDFHDLCYPKKKTTQNGREIPLLSSSDLFQGPLPFYCLGTPQNPLIEIYGQDNAGIYVDGEGITIDDVKIRNCDFGDSLSNLDYVGSVVDVNADNVTIRNCVLSSGKNVLRAYSSQNLIVNNCLLSNARNFLLEIGTNEYRTPNWDEEKSFLTLNGREETAILRDFFADYSSKDVPELSADNILQQYLTTTSLSAKEKEAAIPCLQRLDENLNDTSKVQERYRTSVTVKDTFFYRSGISGIVFDSLFHGPFMETKSPSAFANLILSLQEQGSSNPFPLLADHVGGVSYPSSLKLVGKTRFYDYKKTEDFDLNGLIGQRLSDLVDGVTQTSHQVMIDKIFPIKNLLFPQIQNKGYQVSVSNETSPTTSTYLNVPISYYGGGVNLSALDMTELEAKDEFSSSFSCDLLNASLPVTESTSMNLSSLALKAINLVIGFHPFRFYSYNAKRDRYLFGDSPKLESLIQNAKGGQAL